MTFLARFRSSKITPGATWKIVAPIRKLDGSAPTEQEIAAFQFAGALQRSPSHSMDHFESKTLTVDVVGQNLEISCDAAHTNVLRPGGMVYSVTAVSETASHQVASGVCHVDDIRAANYGVTPFHEIPDYEIGTPWEQDWEVYDDAGEPLDLTTETATIKIYSLAGSLLKTFAAPLVTTADGMIQVRVSSSGMTGLQSGLHVYKIFIDGENGSAPFISGRLRVIV